MRFPMVWLHSLLLLLATHLITAIGQSTTTILNPLPSVLANGYEGTEIQDVNDFCYLRRSNSGSNSVSGKMKLLSVKYLTNNLYDVTIWISGQQISKPGLLENLNITGINGPESEVTVYNSDPIEQPGQISLPDFVITFQSYGVEKGDETWLSHFQLTYTYTDGLEGSSSSSRSTTLGVGCLIVESSLSGYYWKTPVSNGNPIVSNDAPISSTTNAPSQTQGSCSPAPSFTDIQDVQDYCYLRRDDLSGNPDSNKMKLLGVRYMSDNLYNVTIWVSGQQINNPNLLEVLNITGIDGPESETTIYNSGSSGQLGQNSLPDFIATFQSYGVEKGDTTWLPHFQLTYTYTIDPNDPFSSSHDTTLGVGCLIADSSLGLLLENPRPNSKFDYLGLFKQCIRWFQLSWIWQCWI